MQLHRVKWMLMVKDKGAIYPLGGIRVEERTSGQVKWSNKYLKLLLLF